MSGRKFSPTQPSIRHREKAAGTIKVMCLGDSCTYGYNPEPSRPDLRADYPALLARGLKMRGI